MGLIYLPHRCLDGIMRSFVLFFLGGQLLHLTERANSVDKCNQVILRCVIRWCCLFITLTNLNASTLLASMLQNQLYKFNRLQWSSLLCQVSAGRSHSSACVISSSEETASDSVSTPTTVPDQYTALQCISYKHLHGRLLLLNNFSNVVYNSWRFLNLQPDSVCVTYVYACMCAVGS